MSEATATIPPTYKSYCPRGAARELFFCRDEEILLEGPAGTGKTMAALEKANVCMAKYPGARALFVRKTRTSMSESVLVTFESLVVPENAELFPDVGSVLRQNRQTYDYPNGSTIVIGGMDKADKIMSTDYDMIVVFEGHELSEDDIEKLTTRLRHGVIPYQQLIVDTNPQGPNHHLNRRAQAGTMKRLLSRHEDNPRWHDGTTWTIAGLKYLAKLDRLTGARYLRLRKGVWAQAEGVVYGGFDAAKHIIDRRDIPTEWRRIRIIDFGFRNPFVCQWWAIDPDGRMILYRELYGTGKLVEDWAKKILALSEGEKIETTIADHDAEDRATLERYGISTIAAKKEITPGIEAVAARLREDETGSPRILIMRDSLVERDESLAEDAKPCCTDQEFECYVWPKNKDGKPVKEVPVKENDHGMDAMRYAVAYVDGIGTGQVHARLISTTPTPREDRAKYIGDDDAGWNEIWNQA